MAVPKPEAFISLDESLTGAVVREWRKHWADVAVDIRAAFAADDYRGIEVALDRLDYRDAYEASVGTVKFISKQAMLFGVSRHGELRFSKFMKTPGAVDIVETATTQLGASIQISAETFRKSLLRFTHEWLGRKADAKGQVLKADPISESEGEIIRDFVVALEAFAEVAGVSNIAIATSLHTSRLAQYGFCVEADLLGVTSYQINEVLDKRTCPLCEAMNGMVFSVDQVFSRLDRIIRVSDPAELRALNPFPPQTKAGLARIKAMSGADLAAQGWDAPPYHPRCRGYIDVTRQEATWQNQSITAL